MKFFVPQPSSIMISTTIIENGIDIPNSNTIIVHDSLKLGLAQLYQIRGRVGRSDKIAYAYMLYDNKANIREDAKKRLFAIKDFSSLGSGYKLAIRDLSIRGAGDLLGREQSGYIDSVGYEMYSKLVKEVIEGNEGKNISENVIYQYRRYYIRENKSNCCPTLTANMGSGGHNVPIIKDTRGIRKLTPRECFNLQGFPSVYKFPKMSDSALYKLAGNAVSVPVISLVVSKLVNSFTSTSNSCPPYSTSSLS